MFRSICIGVLFMLASGCAVTFDPSDPQAQAIRAAKARIAEYQIVREEQQLTRDILALQAEIALMKLKAKAPPVIEGEFIPADQLPQK